MPQVRKGGRPDVDDEEVTPSVNHGRLTLVERIGASLVALGSGIVALLLLNDPPDVEKAGASCTSKDCVLTVDGDIQSVAVALIALAAAAALIAVLGVRFTKVGAGGATLELASVSEVDEGTAEKDTAGVLKTDSERRALAPALDGEREWDKLPEWAQRAVRDWVYEGSVVKASPREAVIDVAKGAGKGNHAWYVTVRLEDGGTRVLRVATGRGGTTASET
jgi:hypothetical protein